MTEAPDFMPVLSKGAHASPKEGACIMEYVSMLAGERFSDAPECSNLALSRIAQIVNDEMPDDQRHRLVEFLPRLVNTSKGDANENYQITEAVADAIGVQVPGLLSASAFVRILTTLDPFRSVPSTVLVKAGTSANGNQTYHMTTGIQRDADVDGLIKQFDIIISAYEEALGKTRPTGLTPEQVAVIREVVDA